MHFFKIQFNGLLNTCTIKVFGKLLASNSKGYIKCVSLNNEPCQTRPTLIELISIKTLFIHLLSVLTSSVEVYTTDDPHARVFFFAKTVKTMNVKAFNLIAGENEARFLDSKNYLSVNAGWMEVFEIQSENFMIHVFASVKN